MHPEVLIKLSIFGDWREYHDKELLYKKLEICSVR
jgi:hypothetical protein